MPSTQQAECTMSDIQSNIPVMERRKQDSQSREKSGENLKMADERTAFKDLNNYNCIRYVQECKA